MESYDPQKAAAVWQRVLSPQAQPSDGFAPLYDLLRQQAGRYQSLARLTGNTILKKLAAEKQVQAATLRGIRMLLGTPDRHAPLPQPQKEPLDTALRRCFGTEQTLLKQFDQHRDDCQFGPVFSLLAQEQHRHCKWLLEAMGRL